MSKKGSITTSDFIPYEKALLKANTLLKEKDKRVIGLYITLGINTGLRISDLLRLRWEELRNESVSFREKKTNKKKVVKFNDHVKAALRQFNETSGYVFISRKKSLYTIQSINRILKQVFKSELRTRRISSHSLRKAFGRELYERNGQSEKVLTYLSELFNHSSQAITRRYLGIRQEELNDLYDSLN